MRHYRRLGAQVEGLGFNFHFAIGDGDTLMLAEVLGPAFHYEGLDEPARCRGVLVESPANCPVAAAKPSGSSNCAG